jgi:REP element-mobilizing transposase RayT
VLAEENAIVSTPRQVLPGTFYMLTRRCTQRQFLLRPDRRTNEVFLYCLAEAAQRFGIDVILPSVLSNHHHTIVFDRPGRIVEFTEHLHKFVAKAMNALRGRWENFWSSEPPCFVRLVEPSDVLDKLVYAATNPVKDRLVERVHHWPGVNGLAALLHRRTLTIQRPRHFFRDAGPMPPAVTLDLVIPPELGDPDDVRQRLRARVAVIEDEVAASRRRTGAPILGRRAILRQPWRGQPASHAPRRGLRPRVAARSVWSRVEALLRDRAFVDSYRAARLRWRAGLDAVFPPGTYWLRRFAAVHVAPLVKT